MRIRLPIRGIAEIDCAFEQLVATMTDGRRIDLLSTQRRRRVWGFLVPMIRLSATGRSIGVRFVWTGIFQTLDLARNRTPLARGCVQDADTDGPMTRKACKK